MVDISAIASALSSLKAAKDVAETMINLRDASAFQGKMIEFQSKLIDANNAAFAAQEERSALLDQIRQLEKEVADLSEWETEKQRYELKNIHHTGSVAYAIKRDAQGSEPAHWICTACYQNRKKSILQPTGVQHGRDRVYACSVCGLKTLA